MFSQPLDIGAPIWSRHLETLESTQPLDADLNLLNSARRPCLKLRRASQGFVSMWQLTILGIRDCATLELQLVSVQEKPSPDFRGESAATCVQFSTGLTLSRAAVISLNP